jgi:hypothetical protein
LKSVFSSFIIESLSPQRDEALKERERKSNEKRGRKKKSSKGLRIKRGSQYFERRKTFQPQNLFT